MSTASAQVFVGTDPNANTNNFDTPGNTNAVGYSITMTSDATDIILHLATTNPVPQGFGLNFANLYFSTTVAEAVNPGHSTVGFEIENHDAFIPGVSGSVDTSGDGFTVTTAPGSISVTIPWAYFENDPDGLGFDKITTTNNIVRLNLSQSFGYSVAGGTTDYGNAELGEVALPGTVIATPEPSIWSLLVAGVVLLTLPRFWRKRPAYI